MRSREICKTVRNMQAKNTTMADKQISPFASLSRDDKEVLGREDKRRSVERTERGLVEMSDFSTSLEMTESLVERTEKSLVDRTIIKDDHFSHPLLIFSERFFYKVTPDLKIVISLQPFFSLFTAFPLATSMT